MKNKLHVGYDIDGTHANFIKSFTETMSNYFPVDVVEDDRNLQTYNLEEAYGDFKANAVWRHISNDPDFYNRLEPLDAEWIDDTKKLVNRDDVQAHYVTARAHSTIDSIAQVKNKDFNRHQQKRMAQRLRVKTERWLQSRGLQGRLYMARDKGRIARHNNIDLYVDNKTEDVMDVSRKSPTESYLLSKGYNRDANVKNRVETIPHFNNIARTIVDGGNYE